MSSPTPFFQGSSCEIILTDHSFIHPSIHQVCFECLLCARPHAELRQQGNHPMAKTGSQPKSAQDRSQCFWLLPSDFDISFQEDTLVSVILPDFTVCKNWRKTIKNKVKAIILRWSGLFLYALRTSSGNKPEEEDVGWSRSGRTSEVYGYNLDIQPGLQKAALGTCEWMAASGGRMLKSLSKEKLPRTQPTHIRFAVSKKQTFIVLSH
nr:uncharacterized protein LOC116153320 [Camelus dromedarius]